MSTKNRGDGLSQPGRLLSAYNLVRYRARLVKYAITYLSRPKSYELLGILIGLVGAASTLTVFLGFVTDRPVAQNAITVVILLALIFGYLSFRLARIPNILALAARSPERTKRLQMDMRDGLANDDAYQALEWVYAPIVESLNTALAAHGTGRQFTFMLSSTGKAKALAVVMPANSPESLEQLIDPHWVPRPRPWHVRASKVAEQRQSYMASLRSIKGADTGHPFADDETGDNLILDALRIDPETDELRLVVSIGTYGEIVRTSDALINEFAIFAYVGRDKTGELRAVSRLLRRIRFLRWGESTRLTAKSTLKQLPWRRMTHKQSATCSDLFMHPTGRAAGLGVAVTLIKSDESDTTVYTSRRGRSVGTYADVRHVIPAGMCNLKDDIRSADQPIPADFLQWTMLGELLEECYDECEFAGNRSDDWIKCIRDKCDEFGLSTNSPTFTGLAFDLLNLRPEVCATLEVVDPGKQVPATRFKTCWEYNPGTGVQPFNLEQVLGTCERTDWVQSGIASLELARILHSRELNAIKES